MTAELYEFDVTDSERLLIAWLTPVGYRTRTKRRAGDPLPFVIVNELIATEDQQISAYPTMSLKILGETEDQTATAATAVHRRMLLLAADPLQDIILADASVANVEWLETVERPHWEYYSDTIFQKCARYRFGQGFVDVA